MDVLNSNVDVLMVGIPMIAILFACVFRVDELIGRSQQKKSGQAVSRPLSGGFDRRTGLPIGIDPDGAPLSDPGSNGVGTTEVVRPAPAPRRYRSRVSFEATAD